MSRRVHFTFDIAQNVSVGVFYQEALKRDLPRLLTEGWPTTAKLDESAAIWWSVEPHGTTALLEPSAGSLASVHVGFGNVFVQVAASDIESARLGMEEVRKLLPRAEQDREGRIPLTFWSYSPHAQGLSRFLNVVDGLIGQGSRILVLVTTNEELGALHPAIARPGRCAANVLFRRIPPEGRQMNGSTSAATRRPSRSRPLWRRSTPLRKGGTPLPSVRRSGSASCGAALPRP